MFKKMLAILACLCMVFTLVSCGGTDGASENGGAETVEGHGWGNWTEENPFKCAYFTSGTLGDNGNNDEIYNRMQAYMKENPWVQFEFVECGKDYSLYEAIFLEKLDAGLDLFITSCNYSMADIVSPYVPDYPDTFFWIIDATADYDMPYDNMAGMQFMQNEVMFISGAIAAKLSETGIIGFVGGTESTVIIDFGVGYYEGAKYANPDIKIIYSFVGDFNDSAKGKELALAQAAAGADVIHNVAGTAGMGALEGAAEAGVWAIGVDKDQREQFILNGDQKTADHIITSSVKCWGNAVCGFIERWVESKETTTPGVVEKWGWNNGGVDLTENDYYKANCPQEIQDYATDLMKKVSSGEIKVGTGMGMDIEDWYKIKESVALS